MSYKSPVAVKSITEMSVDELASVFESSPYPDSVAGIIEGMNSDFLASVFNSSKLSPAKAALIFNSSYLSISKIVSILNNPNLSVAKAYSILSNANLSADRTQSILYNMPFNSRLVDILTYGAGDLTVSSNTSISGVNRYRTLTVGSGVTLTITGQPGCLIVKTLNNSGTIAKSATGGAGGTPGEAGVGAGGAGGGGLIILADSFVNSGVISADVGNGRNGIDAVAYAKGGTGGSGVFFVVGTDVAGRGGDGGNCSGTSYNPGNVNGGGGGGFGATYVGGSGGGSSYISFSNYTSLATRILQSIIDWFIVNVLGKTPSSTQAIPNVYGSGGGGLSILF